MLAKLQYLNLIRIFSYSGHTRSLIVKHNIAGVFLFRGISVAAGFALISMTVEYLGPIKYGIWVTLCSLIDWLNFSDIGLSAGLRNKLAEAFAKKEETSSQSYISTVYASLFIIAAFIFALFVIINRFLNWPAVLNCPQSMSKELFWLALWTVSFFCLKFVLAPVKTILKADQNTAASCGLDAFASICSVLTVYLVMKATSESLIQLAFWQGLTGVTVLSAATILLFATRYRTIMPSAGSVHITCTRDIYNLGVKFFVIQICSVIIFSTDNLIITQILGPEQVTPYNIVFKYFYIVSVFFSIISTPLWSAYTHAYVQKDFEWIKNTLGRVHLLLIPAAGLIMLMIFVAKPVIIGIWIGHDVGIKTPLVLLMGVYALVQAWNYIYSYFLSGIGEINCTLYTMFAGAVINIPISIFFAKTCGMQNSGVILGTIISLAIFSIAGPLQAHKILSTKTVRA